MAKLKKYLFDKINLDKIINSSNGKKVLIVDRQRIMSVLKNYSAIKILEKKNNLNVSILTDLDQNNEISIFYNFLGFKKFQNTFKFKYLFLFPIISFKTIFHFFNYTFFSITNNLNNFIKEYKVCGIKVGDIIYDRYIRNDYSFLKPSFFDIKFIRIFLFTVFKVYWIEKYLNKEKIKLILINTHIYANNYSIAYKLAKKKKINLLYLKDFQITYYKRGLISKETDPRAITKKKLQTINFSKKEKIYLSQYMKKRISGNLPHFDVKSAFGSKKNQINKFLSQKGVNPDAYLKKILLASHSLSDANHFHSEIGSFSPFKDYYTQVIETLNFAKQNKNILFYIRPHPSSDFWKEEGLIKKTLESYKSKNIVLIDKKINTHDAINSSDTVITAYGTIGLETASYYKKKPILAGRSIYSGLGFTLDSNSKDEYFNHILSAKKNYKLNHKEQKIADKSLYYYFLKFNIDYKSVIANQNRNISDYEYFNNLSTFLKKNLIEKDNYFKKLDKIVKKIKI